MDRYQREKAIDALQTIQRLANTRIADPPSTAGIYPGNWDAYVIPKICDAAQDTMRIQERLLDALAALTPALDALLSEK